MQVLYDYLLGPTEPYPGAVLLIIYYTQVELQRVNLLWRASLASLS